MFNPESLITWDELSPSLQALFKKYQQQIQDNESKLNDVLNKIKDLENKLNEALAGSMFQKLLNEGQNGDIVKVNQNDKSFYPHSEFLNIYPVDKDQDLIEMKKKTNWSDIITTNNYEKDYIKGIIDLRDNTFYEYSEETNSFITHTDYDDKLLNRSFLYNRDLGQFYFYQNKGSYIKILASKE